MRPATEVEEAWRGSQVDTQLVIKRGVDFFKRHGPFDRFAAEAVGRDPHEAVMIGDGIGTDLAAAIAVGARSILMLTGVTTADQVDALDVGARPTAVAADAAALATALDRLATG